MDQVAIDPPDTFSPRGVGASIAIDSGKVVAGKVRSTKLLRQVQQFFELNRGVLLDCWNCHISTAELCRRLKSINWGTDVKVRPPGPSRWCGSKQPTWPQRESVTDAAKEVIDNIDLKETSGRGCQPIPVSR